MSRRRDSDLVAVDELTSAIERLRVRMRRGDFVVPERVADEFDAEEPLNELLDRIDGWCSPRAKLKRYKRRPRDQAAWVWRKWRDQ